MSLDVAALIRANAGILDRSASAGCLTSAGPDVGAGLSSKGASVATSEPISDLSDSGGEDDILREVSVNNELDDGRSREWT